MVDLLGGDDPPPFDIWSGKYATIRERFPGEDLSDDQLAMLCDKFWGVSTSCHADFFVNREKATNRNAYNDRGVLGSRLGLKQSLESMLLLLELRRGPFLTRTDKQGFYTCAHWATTIEAL